MAAGTPITLTGAALGSSGATVQWQVSTNKGKTFTDITGENEQTYSFTPQLTDSGKLYQAVFSKPSGMKTGSITLTVDIPPSMTTVSSNQTAAASTSQKATFTASASSRTPKPGVQWQVSSDGGNTWNAIKGVTSTTLSLNKVSGTQNGTKYRAVFTNLAGQVFSSAATMTVN